MDVSDAHKLLKRATRRGGLDALCDVSPIAIKASLASMPLDVPGSLSPDGSLTTDVLLGNRVELEACVNPLLEALFTVAGARRVGSRTFAFRLGKDPASVDEIATIFDALPAGVIVDEDGAEEAVLRGGFAMVYRKPLASRVTRLFKTDAVIQAAWLEAGKDLVAAPATTGPASYCGVVVSIQSSQLFMKLCTGANLSLMSPNTYRSESLDTLSFTYRRDPVALPAYEALDMLAAAASEGLALYDATPARHMSALRDMLRESVSLHAIAGSPALARVAAGHSLPAAMLDFIDTLVDERDRDTLAATAIAKAGSLTVLPTTAVEAAHVLALADKHTTTTAADAAVVDVAAMATAPPRLVDGLRPYQSEAVGIHLATKNGFSNCMAPGLGKSVTSLAAVRLKSATTPGWRGLVTCPAAIRTQWAREAAIWFPEATVAVLASKRDTAGLAEVLDDAGDNPVLVIGSYEMVVRHLDMLEAIGLDDLFCDEAAVLRNPGTARSKALWQLRLSAKVAVALTGTPIDRSIDDLGRILSWARGDAGLFGEQKLSRQFGRLDTERSRDHFTKAIGPLMFRRDRSEIADELPTVSTEVVMLDPTPAEKRLATAARSELKRIYDDLVEKLDAAETLNPDDPRFDAAKAELASARGAMLGGVTLARMAASDPASIASSDSAGALLLKSAGLVEPAMRGGGTKRAQIVELVCDLVGRDEKVLIFTEFSSVARHLVADFEDADVSVGSITGDVSNAKRDVAATKFQSGSLDVLVLTGAGREGLNLQAASVLIHMDLPWNPSAVVQRVGRAVRIGATSKHLSVLIPLMASTIEERVAAVLVPRAAVALAALDTARGAKASATEIGLSLGGLASAVKESEVGKDLSLLELAREVLTD